MNENITISAEKIQELLDLRYRCELNFERTNLSAQNKEIRRAELIAVETILDMLGIEY